jgi:hypothetical protein
MSLNLQKRDHCRSDLRSHSQRDVIVHVRCKCLTQTAHKHSQRNKETSIEMVLEKRNIEEMTLDELFG